MKFEVLTTVKITILVFLVVTNFSPDDGTSMFPRNVNIDLQVHTAYQPTRTTLTSHDIFALMNS